MGLRLLTRRDHSQKELFTKLQSKGFEQDLIEAVVAEFHKLGYLNEERFAEHFLNFRLAKGYGPERISIELKERGISEAIIAKVIEMADNSWPVLAQKVWKKRFKNQYPSDFATKAKQMRFLQYRGFTHEQIESVFKPVKR